MQSLIKMYPEVKTISRNIFLREKFLRKQQKRQMIRLLNKTVKLLALLKQFLRFPAYSAEVTHLFQAFQA